MKILIVAKTHMYDAACVGGMVHGTGESVRLLQPDETNHPKETDFEVGGVWEIEYKPRPKCVPPHVEDVLILNKRYMGRQMSMPGFLSSRVDPWMGGPENLFDGFVQFSASGSGYVCERGGLPDCSTGYWVPDRPLIRVIRYDKVRYECDDASGAIVSIPYVGFEPPGERIQAGTLVRVSLARWFSHPPENEERCYLQLSGRYV